jgi:hypothetical protein
VESTSSARIGRRLGVLLAALAVVGSLALPASANTQATSPGVQLTNDPSANWCVWGSNDIFWVQFNPFVVVNGNTTSDNYGCSVPKPLPANFLAVKVSLWYGGWPNIVLCALYHPYSVNSANGYRATSFDSPTPCGNYQLYWGIGYHLVFLYPGFWYPTPTANSLSGPVDGCTGTCV